MTWAESGARISIGRWSIETRGDELADISFDRRVVLRSIRLVLRDRDWGTADLEATISDPVNTGFALRVRGAGLAGTIVVQAEDAVLRVTASVVAERDIETNRLGLVVLHRPEIAGSPLTVTHDDGSLSRIRFPSDISPHQPAMRITGLAWEHDGLAVSTTLSGDVFEMEDQRNWTDASFKTYSRPLDLPFPYRIAVGARVTQSVTVAVHEQHPARTGDDPDDIALEPAGHVPEIGVGAATGPDPAPDVTPIGSFVRVEIDLASPAWRAALARAAATGRPLDVRFVRVDVAPERLGEAIAMVRDHPVRRMGAYADRGDRRHSADAATVSRLRAALRAHDLDVPVIGGVRTHFTELNRGVAALSDDVDGIGFAVTPLFHSRATAQLVESLVIQRLVATQAVHLARGLPVHVGPVTLRPHVNAVSTTPEPTPAAPDLRVGYGPALLDADDPRQSAPQLAAWAIASLAALTVPGVASTAFFEEWGPRGIADDAGVDRPVAAALRAAAGLAGAPASVGCSADGRVWVLRAETAGGATVLVANLDTVDRVTRLRGPGPIVSALVPAGEWRRLVVS